LKKAKTGCSFQCSDPTPANIKILGLAANYVILAGSMTTNAGATSVVGSLGVSPGNMIAGTAVTQTCGHFDAGVVASLLAQTILTNAYNFLFGAIAETDLTGTDLGGLTLTPGIYGFDTGAHIDALGLTLDAQGDPDAQWIFQMGTTLVVAVNAQVQVINGGSNLNVYWQVGSSASIMTNAVMVGNIVALHDISFSVGATHVGRALASIGGVTMLSNVISNVLCVN